MITPTVKSIDATVEALVNVRRDVLDHDEIVAIDDAILVLMDYREVAALAEMLSAALHGRRADA